MKNLVILKLQILKISYKQGDRMYKFTIFKNGFLTKDIQAYYDDEMIAYGVSKVLTPMHILKNDLRNRNIFELINAQNKVKYAIKEFIKWKFKNKFDKILVCVVPRSKPNFASNQLYFKMGVKEAINELNLSHIMDGVEYIKRVKETKTTHLANSNISGNGGAKPYPGITKDTCVISNLVKGKKILLIDDIYTIGCNVDEDCIEALYDSGAREVIFYALGRTDKQNNTKSTRIIK